jgi:hypothetical protein
VESLARPGSNVTGLSLIAADLAGKRLEILRYPGQLGLASGSGVMPGLCSIVITPSLFAAAG